MFDHWRYQDRELAPLRSDPYPSQQYERTPPPESPPRLDMRGYTYPEDFDIGAYARVRRLNMLLQSYYGRIGDEVDDLSRKTEVYNREKYWSVGDTNHNNMKSAEAKLKKSISKAIPLLAELDAIGAPHHIPHQLRDKIQMKQYVPFGSLAHLPGVNFYYSEHMEDVPNATANQKQLLVRISFAVNRATFLQECGHVFRERIQYAGLYESLKLDYQKLQDDNFQMDLQPALINRARQILAQEPERLKAQRRKEEEEKKRKEEEKKRKEEKRKEEERKERQWRRLHAIFPPPPSPPSSSSSSEEGAVEVEEVPGAVEEGEVHGDAEEVLEEGEVHEDAAVEEGEVQVAHEVQGVVWQGHHTYFHYPSDEE